MVNLGSLIEFEDFLTCGRLEHDFLRVRCDSCYAEHLIAFSCKRKGGCLSYGARRMAESAALLVNEVLPEQPMRQWALSFPFPLRFMFARRPEIMGRVLGVVYRVIGIVVYDGVNSMNVIGPRYVLAQSMGAKNS